MLPEPKYLNEEEPLTNPLCFYAVYIPDQPESTYHTGYVYEGCPEGGIYTPVFMTNDIEEARKFLEKMRSQHPGIQYDLHKVYHMTYKIPG